MIKSLLFLSALLGVQTMPVHTDHQYVGQQERQYQHTEDIGGNTEVTYRFETNEVNSIDDLVVGNIYQFDATNIVLPESTVVFFDAYYIVATIDTQNAYLSLTDNNIGFVRLYAPNQILRVYYYGNNESFTNKIDKSIVFFQYKSDFNADYIQYVSSTTYNEIVSVSYNAPTSLFGLMSDFFDQYIYSGIPHINDINYEVNGTTITMKDWLVVSTTIAVVILFLFILFFIFRWLIRTFSNAFLWR